MTFTSQPRLATPHHSGALGWAAEAPPRTESSQFLFDLAKGAQTLSSFCYSPPLSRPPEPSYTMAARNPQLKLLKDQPKAFGGTLLNTRKGRSQPRPLDTKNTMHLILRSSKARGHRAFWTERNRKLINQIVAKSARRFGIKILTFANVGNHLHFHIKLGNRFTYAPFIRALTASIAMAVTGASRWQPMRESDAPYSLENRFWDYRPYTRVVQSHRAYLNLKDYISINQAEGFGLGRPEARFFVAWDKQKLADSG